VDRKTIEAQLFTQAPELKTFIVQGQTYEVMDASDLLIITSGTATLEAAILGKPMVIVYRGSWLMGLEYHIRRSQVSMIGLPNILAGKLIAPELIQEQASPSNIAAHAINILQNPEQAAQMSIALEEATRCLGKPGAIQKVADMVFELGGLPLTHSSSF
jgi:lipid-A-disaccharide synthase